MRPEGALGELSDFAVGHESGEIHVHAASLALDERRDGEPVTRIMLLVNDPAGDTWELDSVLRLRRDLARRAVELGLPTVSVSLVPESDADSVEDFVR
ncbi:MAG TPA: hypothetical protein VMT37_15960 [Solirubrobacterales bacterium]|nr:hypothetical protein [Solirubrobacterales bacterium]